MENRINKVIKLGNGKNYYILKQAIYNNESYYTAVQVDDACEKFTDEYALLHETLEDGKVMFSRVVDPKLIELLLKYMPAPEVEEEVNE